MQSMKRSLPVRIMLLLLVMLLAGQILGPGSAAAADEASAPRESIVIGGTGSSLGAMSLLAGAYMKEHPEAIIKVLPSLGSGGGIKALIKKRIDFSLSVRPLKDKEKAQGLTVKVYALSPFVFATTAASSHFNITYEQLRAVYAGEIRAWPDGSPINLIVRPSQESDTLRIKSMTPELDKAVDKALSRYGMIFAVTDQDTADLLESTKGALASLSLGQIMAENRSVRILSLEGTPPLIDGKVNPAYPYFKTYYMILRPDMSSAAKRFTDFVFSDQGAEILLKTGHIQP